MDTACLSVNILIGVSAGMMRAIATSVMTRVDAFFGALPGTAAPRNSAKRSLSAPGQWTQPNATSGSKFGSNGPALFLSARMVMGHSRNEVAGASAQRPRPEFF